MSFIADLQSLGKKTPAPATKTEEVVKPAVVLKDMKEKLKALEAVNAALNAQFKTTNSLVRLGDKVGKPIPSYSTGLPTLDWGVIQSGGLPKGRIVEVFGPESAGKTTIALQFIAACQAEGNLAAFVDAEHALDPSQAATIGVDVKNLVISQPDTGEQALDTVIALVDSGAVSLIVVDSVAALVPRAELEADSIGDAHIGLQARLMSSAMRKLVGRCEANECTVVFINQIREKIGVMYGSNETTPGGRALRFFASLRLDIRRKSEPNSGDAKLFGHTIRIKAVKNKVGSPFQETEVYLDYDNGLDKFGDFVTYCKDMGVIEGTTWLKFDGENIAQGLDKTKDVLRNNPTLMEKIRAKLAKVRAGEK